jgi:hypothetical protein
MISVVIVIAILLAILVFIAIAGTIFIFNAIHDIGDNLNHHLHDIEDRIEVIVGIMDDIQVRMRG